MSRVSGWRRGFWLAAAGLLVWLLGWIWLSWPYELDDALIHLRYAENLLQGRGITYDGVHASFGTSSLLYVGVLAGLRGVWGSALLPRVVSSVAYVVLFGAMVVVLWRGLRRGASGAVWLMAVAVLAVVVAPSAVRWLDDGMETGLVFLDAVCGLALLWRMRRGEGGWGLGVVAFGWGLLTVWLRVELLLLVVCVSVMAWLVGRHWRAVWPLVGGLVAAGAVRLAMGTLLPDTAVAKAFGMGAWRSTLEMTAVTLASSFSFGLGLLVLWLASMAGMVASRRLRLADVPGNLLFPVLVLMAAARGQQIQGVRYFGWAMLFPLLWNVLRLAEAPVEKKVARGLGWVAVVVMVALLPAFAWESGVFARLFAGRVATLRAFQGQDLRGLRGQPGIAEDVGFVGYFTGGLICDPYGLVNGRAAARLDYRRRFARCMAERPVFAFGSRLFLQKVTAARSLAGWVVCGSYGFNNVRDPDVHYLVVAPGVAAGVCGAGGEPVERVLPGLV